MWMCYRSIQLKDKEMWDLLGGLDTKRSCFGDELYDHMVYMRWINSIKNYDCSGDSNSVLVTGIDKKFGNFKWAWESEKCW